MILILPTHAFRLGTQDLPQYSHLFLVVGVGSKHGTKGASKGTNVPSIEPATDFVEGAFSAHHNRQRSEEVGRAKRRSAEAQARTLKD